MCLPWDSDNPCPYCGNKSPDQRIAKLEAQIAEQREHQRRCTREWWLAEEKLARVRSALVEHSPTKALAILDSKSREEG